jgi:hypothetical protein
MSAIRVSALMSAIRVSAYALPILSGLGEIHYMGFEHNAVQHL